ncbi:MAG: hypothetical protein H6718_21280 [Polyangiaceae bacterium]|nr:hypothetical protein [Polyangiaceae bacterium]
MGWSYFWIGDFDLNPAAPTPRGFAKPPKSGAVVIDHLTREGRRLLFLRVEDRDSSSEEELTAAVRGLKRKNAQGQLSCIAWEDGPDDYGVMWPVYGRRRKLTRAEIKELFAAHVESMREIVDEAAAALATAAPVAGQPKTERKKAPAKPRATSKLQSPEKLVAALEKGQPGARAKALLALADVDPEQARRTAFEWLVRWEGVYTPGKWLHQPNAGFPEETTLVNREKQFEAAITVLARNLDDAAVDALLGLKPYHPSGHGLARQALVEAMSPQIAEKICDLMVPGLKVTHYSWYLDLLAMGELVGDVALVKRMLRDPMSFDPQGERPISLRVDALKVFWWARHPEAVALTCELLSEEPFCEWGGWFTSKLDDLRIDYAQLLDSPLLPRDKLHPRVLEDLEQARNPEPELTPEQIREVLREARKEAGGVFDDK